jgi:quercetin dioxygenase-like cupin family protein
MALLPPEEQAYGVEIHMADDVFIKQMVVPKAYSIVPQHSHRYDHTSMLAAGAIKVWEDDVYKGSFMAPTGIMIKAGVKHKFMTLVDNTVIYCIHNLSRSDIVEVLEEHHLMER